MRPRGDTHDGRLTAVTATIAPRHPSARELVRFWLIVAGYLAFCAACWAGLVLLVLWVLP